MAPTTKQRTIRLEITIEAPDDPTTRDEWRGFDSELLSKVLRVATREPADKAITFCDAFETVGITVVGVSPVEIGGETPEYSDAARVAERWYHAEVSHCADGVIETLKEGEADDREEQITESLFDAIDGRQCIIYTAQARMVLAATRNADALEEAQGDGVEATFEQRAFYAMEQDVREEIERRRDEWHPDHMPDAETSDDETESEG